MSFTDHHAPRRERLQPEFTTRIGDRPPSYRAENDPHLKAFFSNPNNARIVEMAKTTERGVSQAEMLRIQSKHLEGATMANIRSRSINRPLQKSPNTDAKSYRKSTKHGNGSPKTSTTEQQLEYSPYLERICSPQTRYHNEISNLNKSEKFMTRDRGSTSLVSRSGNQSLVKTSQGASMALRAHNAVASLTRMWEALEIPYSERDYAYSQLNRSSTLTVEYQKRMHTLLEYRKLFRTLLQERIICKNETVALLNSGKGSRKVLTELLTKFKVLTIQLSSLANACRFLCDKPICLPNIKISDKAEDSWFMYLKQECFYTRETTALVFAILKFMPEMTLPEIQEVVNIFYDQCINCDETGDLFDLYDQKHPRNGADQGPLDKDLMCDSATRTPSLSDEDVSLYFLLGLQADAVFAGDDLPICWDAHLHALKGCYTSVTDLPVPLLTPQQLLDAITAEQDTLLDFGTILKFVNEQQKTLVIIPVYPTSDDWEAYQVEDRDNTTQKRSMTCFKSYCQPLPEFYCGDSDKSIHPIIEPNYVSKSIVGYSTGTRSNTKPVLFAREEEPATTRESSLPMPLKKIISRGEEAEVMNSNASDKAIYDENGQILNTTYHMPAMSKVEPTPITEEELYEAEGQARTPSERTDDKYIYNRYEVIETVTTVEQIGDEPPAVRAPLDPVMDESYQRAETPQCEESVEEPPAVRAPLDPVMDESYQRAETPQCEESVEEPPAVRAPLDPVMDESYQRAETPQCEESVEEPPAVRAPLDPVMDESYQRAETPQCEESVEEPPAVRAPLDPVMDESYQRAETPQCEESVEEPPAVRAPLDPVMDESYQRAETPQCEESVEEPPAVRAPLDPVMDESYQRAETPQCEESVEEPPAVRAPLDPVMDESYQRAETPQCEESVEEPPAVRAPLDPVMDESYQRAETPQCEESVEEPPAVRAPLDPVMDESYQRAETPQCEESVEEPPAVRAPLDDLSSTYQQSLPMPPYYTKNLSYDVEPNGADYDLPIDEGSLQIPFTVYIESEVMEYAEPVAENSIHLYDVSGHGSDEQ